MGQSMTTREIVRHCFIFSSLDDRELDEIVRITAKKRFSAGDFIMQEGDGGDSMYLITAGEVEVSKSLTMKFGDDDFREIEKVLNRYRPEDHAVFGEMALISREKRSASIIAKTDCQLLEIKRDDFLKLIEEKHGLGVRVLMKLLEFLVSRLRQSGQDVIRLTTALSIALSK